MRARLHAHRRVLAPIATVSADASGTQFDLAGVERVVLGFERCGADAARRAIFDAAEAHAGHGSVDDDRTVLALLREG